MSKNKETSQPDSIMGEFFSLPNRGLRSYFDLVEHGQPNEYRTTFAKGDTVEEVLNDWEPHLDQLANEWPSLLAFENDLRSKVGPMSIMKPLAERMEDIDHYYSDITLQSTPISEAALKAVTAEFKAIKGLRIRGQQHTVDQMKKSTNSGSPYFTKRRDVLRSTLFCDVWQDGERTFQSLDLPVGDDYAGYMHPATWKGHMWQSCAVLGWRGQEGGPDADDVKQRVVWMFPFAVNILELQVYQPLIESCQKFNLVPAWVSMDAVDRRITRMFETKGVDDLVICTDFSKFDQHFNGDMQDGARFILESLLSQSQHQKAWFRNVFPIKYNIPLAYDWGKIKYGKHGMGSGSGGTNVDETLAHRALQYEAAILNHKRLNPNSQCLGDDGVLTYPGINVDDVIRTYTAHGQEMNVSKQYVSKDDCVYLRRWHHRDYRIGGICSGVYSTYRALGRLMEQERYYDPEVWSREMVALRQLSILENVKTHPMNKEFVKFCMERDKYRLGVDIPGFLNNIDKYAQEAIDYMPDFLGYTKSIAKEQMGLRTWWVVQYLKSFL